jgi:transcriptional regulator with XRE-family HTH domain
VTPETFGERVRFYRQARGWDQKELARRIQRSVPVISRVERGKPSVTLRDIAVIANALNVPVEYLLVGEHSREAVPSEIVVECVHQAQTSLAQLMATVQTLALVSAVHPSDA